MCSSFDLPGPWNTAAVLMGNGLTGGGRYVRQRRAALRRKAAGQEVLFYAVVAVLLLVFSWTAVAGSYALRPFTETVIRRNGHG
ncbi:hypothetical protein IPZ70_18715 [Streptomyces polychromogenes]|nr:hypothetical protein [Streptomyces polychromogenes]